MFNINDSVSYSGNVYTVRNIKKLDLGMGERDYYILESVHEASGTVYVPLNAGKAKLKKLLCRQEIADVIALTHGRCLEWQEDGRLRRETAARILHEGKHEDIVLLAKAYSAKKSELESRNKKFYVADDKVLQQAAELLFREFSLSVDIQREQLIPLLNGEITI